MVHPRSVKLLYIKEAKSEPFISILSYTGFCIVLQCHQQLLNGWLGVGWTENQPRDNYALMCVSFQTHIIYVLIASFDLMMKVCYTNNWCNCAIVLSSCRELTLWLKISLYYCLTHWTHCPLPSSLLTEPGANATENWAMCDVICDKKLGIKR